MSKPKPDESPIPKFEFPVGARVTLAQLFELGFSAGHVDYLVAHGNLTPVGVFNKVSYEVATAA